MKKRVVLSLVLIVLVSLILISCVYAQDDAAVVPLEEEEDNVGNEDKEVDIPTDIKKGVEEVKGIKEKTEETLEQDIVVPEKLQIPARIIFGVKGEIPLNIFIVLIGVWIVIFLLIEKILEFTPFFEGLRAWIGAFVITCLIAITGAIRSVVVFLFNLANIFGILEKWSVLKIVVVLIILAVFFYGLSILMKMLNKKLMLDRADVEGTEAGAGIRLAKETFKQATKS